MKQGGDLGKVRFRSHRVQGSGFRVQDSRVVHGACRPLIACERGAGSMDGFSGFKGGGAAHT